MVTPPPRTYLSAFSPFRFQSFVFALASGIMVLISCSSNLKGRKHQSLCRSLRLMVWGPPQIYFLLIFQYKVKKTLV